MNFLQNHLHCIIEMIIILFSVYVSFIIIDKVNKSIQTKILALNTNTKFLKFAPILSKLTKALVAFVAIAIVMQRHGYSMTSLIAGFGVTGLAVGFAAKETIANLFGSFAILYDNIYDVGDYIIVNGVEGTVEDINLRSTKIRSLDSVLTNIPNNIIANAVVQNVSNSNFRRINETFGLVYDTSTEKIDRAMDILKEILNSHDDIESRFSVYLDKFDNSSINICMVAFTKTPDLPNLRRIKTEILKEILQSFRKENIEFAYPSQTLYLNNNEN